MKFSIFKTLLVLIVLIPTLLGFFVFKGEILTLVPSIFAIVSLILFAIEKNKIFKRFTKILFFSLLLMHSITSLTKLSLDNLPLILFGVAQIFIFYILWWKNSFRKFLYVALLSFLNLTVISLYFANLNFGIFLALYLLLILYFFLLLGAKAYEKEEKNLVLYLLKYSIFTYIVVFVFGTVLFFVLPRPSQPIFSLIHKQQVKPKIGFSNEIKLGQFNSIASDPTVAFRAKIPTKPQELYWRGNTLEKFDGKVWISFKGTYAKVIKEPIKGFKETLLIPPYGGKSIFLFGYPKKIVKSSIEGLIINRSKNVVISKRNITEPSKVVLLAVKPSKVRVNLVNRKPLLEIPKSIKPLIRQIVKKYHLKGKSFYETKLKVSKYFERFRYALNNKAKNLIEFLDIYKSGNCEYFASASALIFRYLGYPTRVVVGFYGGDYNPLTGYYVVREKNAHAWIEIFYKNRWWRFDATRYASVGKNVERNLQTVNLEKNKMLLFWDTLNTIWFEYVVNLNQKKQVEIFNNLKRKFSSIPNLFRFNKEIAYPLLVVFILLPILFYKEILTFLIKLLISLRERDLKILQLSAIEIYIYLWIDKPNKFKRYKQILKTIL